MRILGLSECPEFEVRTALYARGNNLRLRDDMTRRAVVCNLDAEVERPELRKLSFDPLVRAQENRGRYVAAVLTIVRAYRAAGSSPVCGADR
jgi:putative DNA primase/helicase